MYVPVVMRRSLTVNTTVYSFLTGPCEATRDGTRRGSNRGRGPKGHFRKTVKGLRRNEKELVKVKLVYIIFDSKEKMYVQNKQGNVHF